MAGNIVADFYMRLGIVDDASRNLQNIQKSVNQLSKTTLGLQKTAFVAGTAIGALGFALISFGRQAFMESARVRELDVAMQAIGKSTGFGYQKINAATQAIRGMGIELAASQQIAIEFAQNNLDMASASKVARVAQDLAVIGQKNSTETTMLLTRAIITGRTELLKSAGIQKSAGQMYEEYAQTLGKATTAMSAVEKQTAVLNGVIEEGTRVAGTYEAAMQEPGKVLRSFPRLLNDIQVAMGSGLTDGFGPSIMAAYDLTKAFAKAVGESSQLKKETYLVQNELGKFEEKTRMVNAGAGKLEGIITLVKVAADSLIAPFQDLIEIMTKLIKNLSFSKTEAIKFIQPLKDMIPVITAASVALSAFAGQKLLAQIPFLSKFAAALNPIAAGLVVLVALSPGLRTAFLNLVSAFQPLVPILFAVGSAIAQGLTNALKIVTPLISSLVDFVVNLLKPLQSLKTDGDNAGKTIKILADFVTGAGLAFVAYKTYMLLAAGATRIFAAGQAIAAFASLGLVGALKAVKVALIGTGIGAIVVLIGTLAAAFYTAWQNSQTFRDKVTGVFNALRPIIQMFVDFFLFQLNIFIKAWNALPFTDKIEELKYEVGEWKASTLDSINGVVDGYQYLNDESKAAMMARAAEMRKKRKEEKSILEQQLSDVKSFVDSYNKTIREAYQSFASFVDEASQGGGSVSTSLTNVNSAFDNFYKILKKTKKPSESLAESFKDLSSIIQSEFGKALSDAQNQLAQAQADYRDFKNSIKSSITSVVNFGAALSSGDFLTGLTNQAENAKGFADKVKQLIKLGLSKSAIQQILSQGYEAGGAIADQIISGGKTVVNQVNNLMSSVDSVAEQVGTLGAETFFGAGVNQANALVNGILAQMEIRKKELEAIAAQIAALMTGTGVTFAPNKKNKGKNNKGKGGKPKGKGGKGAYGALVKSPTMMMMGEAGPEALIPLSKRSIVQDLRKLIPPDTKTMQPIRPPFRRPPKFDSPIFKPMPEDRIIRKPKPGDYGGLVVNVNAGNVVGSKDALIKEVQKGLREYSRRNGTVNING